MAVEFFIHKMSEHMETAQILKWLVQEGDRVAKFQIIMEVMTDKVTAELEAPEAGIIKGIRPGAVDGAVVPIGEPICYIAAPDEVVPTLPPLKGTPEVPVGRGEVASPEIAPPEVASPMQPELVEVTGVRATPVARRVAKELGVDIARVTGTGPLGRVTEADVRHAARAEATSVSALDRQILGVAAASSVPAVPSSSPGEPPAGSIPAHAVSPVLPAAHRPGLPLPTEWLALTPVQRITGERMRESVVSAPQFALDADVDMTAVLWLRDEIGDRVAAEAGEKPSVTGLLVMVVAAALRHHPRAHAEYAGDRLKVHTEINVGVAVGTENGLLVPVIKNADRKSLAEITRELAGFQEKAKTLRFSVDDLSDGAFTVSNLGMFGVDRFRAIINPPQSAILAVGRIAKIPVGLADDTIGLRPMMSLTLTVDHRCMDGIQAAQFLAEVKELLEKPHLLLA